MRLTEAQRTGLAACRRHGVLDQGWFAVPLRHWSGYVEVTIRTVRALAGLGLLEMRGERFARVTDAGRAAKIEDVPES